MESFKVTKKRRVDQDDQGSLEILFQAPDLLVQITKLFVVTEFERPRTTSDYVNLALTCKFLLNLLLNNPHESLRGAVVTTCTARKALVQALGGSRLNSSGNLTWRVTFETDLCVLAFYRHGIVRDGVQFVASAAAEMLASIDSRVVQKVIDQRMTTSRFFGSVGKLEANVLIEHLHSGSCRIETIMFVFQCMGFFLAQELGLPTLKMPPSFLDDRKQVVKTSEDPVTTRCLGITDSGILYTFSDLELHSSALGRVVRSTSRNSGFGQIQDSQELPLVGGPSGSSRAIFAVAMKAGLVNPEHIRQFILATIAFLVGGGQHSVDEVIFGLPDVISVLNFQHGKYLALLPESLTYTSEWKMILMKYRDYLDQL